MSVCVRKRAAGGFCTAASVAYVEWTGGRVSSGAISMRCSPFTAKSLSSTVQNNNNHRHRLCISINKRQTGRLIKEGLVKVREIISVEVVVVFVSECVRVV